jgi:tRNA-uridine 2-sulfurtransferase
MLAGMRIVAALSGGVDSAVAASRLLREGADVVGVHYRTGVEAEGASAARSRSCCGADDARDARAVAAALGIPFYVLDVSEVFSTAVIGAFVAAYAAGRTPNPCVDCNRSVKFGRLADLARGFGAEAVATGHYARVLAGEDGRPRLLRGVDERKDQSYVLAGLSIEQLRHARFPLGSSTKEEVRAEARSLGLPVAEKPDSQELCFVPSGDHRSVLSERAPGLLREGDVVDAEGRTLGRHGGAAAFTLGQRRGHGVAAATALHVTAVDPRRNVVTLGPREACLRRAVTVADVNPLDADPARWAVGETHEIEARVRHGQPPIPATATRLESGLVEATFSEPVFAPAAGQAFVAYRGDAVLFAGTIDGSTIDGSTIDGSTIDGSR